LLAAGCSLGAPQIEGPSAMRAAYAEPATDNMLAGLEVGDYASSAAT